MMMTMVVATPTLQDGKLEVAGCSSSERNNPRHPQQVHVDVYDHSNYLFVGVGDNDFDINSFAVGFR